MILLLLQNENNHFEHNFLTQNSEQNFSTQTNWAQFLRTQS